MSSQTSDPARAYPCRTYVNPSKRYFFKNPSKKYILNLSISTANSCRLTLMMEGSIFHLLEVIYAKAVACEVQNIRREVCCGCKVRQQDCLMMTELEGWRMHGLAAIEQVNNKRSVWQEFLEVTRILNVNVRKDFTDHLLQLEEEPDQEFVDSLLQVYEDNQSLLHALCDLSDWNPQTDPLESYAECYFSLPPSYTYYVKGTNEKFRSRETDHKKAYQKHLENKLREQLLNFSRI